MADETKNTEHGGISVEIEHIFPIIKKWLYSEKEIFLREIVSNSCDAVTKLKRLSSLGKIHDIDESSFKITVTLDKEARTITVTDNGIGMNEEELKKYLCQIALSGALDFIKKYEGEDASSNGIIGHFGLGFYSSFMVSDTVDVISRSFDGSPAVKWTCSEAGDYEITPDYDGDEVGEHGCAVIMHISSEGEEFLSEYKLRDVLEKYCSFMPVEIYFECVGSEKEADAEGKEEAEKEEEAEKKPINDTHPLWLKNASDCTEDEYRDFYRRLFNDYKEPLFHIHLSADYPLNFKGILYFPKIQSEFESLEGQVKLYYNQVFVADNIKEVIPDYLLMLKGVLDCPELPLNVSRSYLQNSGYVAKISAHITKKVADKLTSMYKSDRVGYEKIWRDIKTFVEYGSLRDRRFYDRVSEAVLFEKCSGAFCTLDEYLEGAKGKNDNKIYYTNDRTSQARYISILGSEGIEVVVLDKIIDSQFITTVEQAKEGVKFCRVDGETPDSIKDGEAEEMPGVKKLFEPMCSEHIKLGFEKLKDEKTPAILTFSEESRRIEDMMKLYAMAGEDTSKAFPTEGKFIVNTSSPLIAKLEAMADSDSEKAEKIAHEIWSLALMSQRRLTADELNEFLNSSYDILATM